MQRDTEAFHKRHEALTDRIYYTPGMLPARYVFVLTSRCNLNCSFCYQNQKTAAESMTSADWIQLGGQLPAYARVTLTGGEPFLFGGFQKVFSFIAERFDCNIISNGLLLNEDLIRFLLSFPKFRVLSISVDNVGNTFRGVNPAKWNKTEAMLQFFADCRDDLQSECILDVKTIVLDENADALLEIHKYCVEELCCDNHSFQFLKGSPIQHADKMYPYEDIFEKTKAQVYKKIDTIREQLDRVREYNLKYGKKAFMHPQIASLNNKQPLANLDCLNQPYHIQAAFRPCRYPWASVHINSDGSLFPCLAVSMGNIRRAPLKEIIRGDAFARFKEMLKCSGTVQGCNRCGWLKFRLPGPD